MKPQLEGGSMMFGQEGDSINDTPQSLVIEVQDAGAGKFYVLSSERWAFENRADIDMLIDQVTRAFMLNDSKGQS